MSRINNPMEIFKLLNGSNCRDCHEKTCLAFAVAVFKGKKPIEACPHLSPEILRQYGGKTEKPNTIDEDMAAAVETLKREIPAADLAQAALRIGANFANGRLTVSVFGKPFSVDRTGGLSSEIHINAWVAVPVLNHVLHGKGEKPTGNWITFRELSGGPPRHAHFQQRCEKPLKKVADTYTDLFQDMLDIFDGKQVQGHIDADIAILLHPLPRFPMEICYWKPEDGMDSSLHIFFDAASNQNLDIESIYTMSEGVVRMFDKIARRHGA